MNTREQQDVMEIELKIWRCCSKLSTGLLSIFINVPNLAGFEFPHLKKDGLPESDVLKIKNIWKHL